MYVLVKCNAFKIPHNRSHQNRDRTNHTNIYLLNLSLADQMYLLCVPFVEIMPQIHKRIRIDRTDPSEYQNNWSPDRTKFYRYVNSCKRGWTFGLTVCRITTAVDNAYQVQLTLPIVNFTIEIIYNKLFNLFNNLYIQIIYFI